MIRLKSGPEMGYGSSDSKRTCWPRGRWLEFSSPRRRDPGSSRKCLSGNSTSLSSKMAISISEIAPSGAKWANIENLACTAACEHLEGRLIQTETTIPHRTEKSGTLTLCIYSFASAVGV